MVLQGAGWCLGKLWNSIVPLNYYSSSSHCPFWLFNFNRCCQRSGEGMFRRCKRVEVPRQSWWDKVRWSHTQLDTIERNFVQKYFSFSFFFQKAPVAWNGNTAKIIPLLKNLERLEITTIAGINISLILYWSTHPGKIFRFFFFQYIGIQVTTAIHGVTKIRAEVGRIVWSQSVRMEQV